MAILLVWSHFGLLGTSCLKTVSAEVAWHWVESLSLVNSSMWDRSFHTDLSSLLILLPFQIPRWCLNWKSWQPHSWSWFCLVQAVFFVSHKFLFLSLCLPLSCFFFLAHTVVCSGAAYSVSSCTSLDRRCYSLARTANRQFISLPTQTSDL